MSNSEITVVFITVVFIWMFSSTYIEIGCMEVHKQIGPQSGGESLVDTADPTQNGDLVDVYPVPVYSDVVDGDATVIRRAAAKSSRGM